jgi:hypothetical protein
MGLFTRRNPSAPDKVATKAFKRGDHVYVRIVHAIPGRPDGGLAQAITRIEAAGWALEHQQEGEKNAHGYRQVYWTLTFRPKPVPSPAS